MKILFATDQIYLHGGIEKVMAEKANYFADYLGYEVFILTTEQKANKPCYKISDKVKFIDLGVNYVRNKSYFHPINLMKIPCHFMKWYKTLKKVKPDFLILCNYSFDNYWTPFFFKFIVKFKEFHTSRSVEIEERKSGSFFKKLNFRINDYIESKYDRLIVLNEDEAKYFKTNNIEIIPNSITINSENKAELINKKAIAAGRIASVKGFEKAIKIWENIVSKNPEWILDIYGQGDENYIKNLENKIRETNMQNNVFIKKAVSNIDEVLLDYSVYLMTSLTECFPMILLEALASGLPIVSFDCPHGPRNIVTNNIDGFIVENQNIELAVEKVELLINDFQLRNNMGTNAKINCIKFSTQVVMSKWKILFEKNKRG